MKKDIKYRNFRKVVMYHVDTMKVEVTKNISWIHLGFSVIIKYSFANVFKVE